MITCNAKKGPGRPRKPAKERKEHQVKVSCTADQLAYLQRMAELDQRSVAEWVLLEALAGYRPDWRERYDAREG